MKLYTKRYLIENRADEASTYFEQEFTKSDSNQNVDIYEKNFGYIGEKVFIHHKDKNRLYEELQADRKYTLILSYVLVVNYFLFYNILFAGLGKKIVLLTTGIGSFGLAMVPIIAAQSAPEVINVPHRNGSIFPIPEFRKYQQKVHIPVYIFLLVSLADLSSWIWPRFTLLNILLIALILICPFAVHNSQPIDSATKRSLFLISLNMLPIFSIVASLFAISQAEPYWNQTVSLMDYVGASEVVEIIEPGSELSYPIYITIILLISSAFIYSCISWGPKLWNAICDEEPTNPHTEFVTSRRWSRSVLLVIYLFYWTILIATLMFFFLNNLLLDVVPTGLIPLLCMPGGVLIGIYTYTYLTYYIRIRKEIKNISNKNEIDILPDSDTQVFLSSIPNGSAMSVNLINMKPTILLDCEFAKNLTQNEIRAVVLHEEYHILKSTTMTQRLTNIPVIGPILFILFVNPYKVFWEEFQADLYATIRTENSVVISAIEKSKDQDVTKNNPLNTPEQVKDARDLVSLVVLIPLVSLYRPSREERIQRLENLSK